MLLLLLFILPRSSAVAASRSIDFCFGAALPLCESAPPRRRAPKRCDGAARGKLSASLWLQVEHGRRGWCYLLLRRYFIMASPLLHYGIASLMVASCPCASAPRGLSAQHSGTHGQMRRGKQAAILSLFLSHTPSRLHTRNRAPRSSCRHASLGAGPEALDLGVLGLLCGLERHLCHLRRYLRAHTLHNVSAGPRSAKAQSARCQACCESKMQATAGSSASETGMRVRVCGLVRVPHRRSGRHRRPSTTSCPPSASDRTPRAPKTQKRHACHPPELWRAGHRTVASAQGPAANRSKTECRCMVRKGTLSWNSRFS